VASIPFTKDELGELTKADLINLAKYFGIDYNKHYSKSKLINLIDEARDPDPVTGVTAQEGTGYPEMSVRVRRIHELKMKGREI